ncbi:hypothetical protein COV06_00185 [Candidatus Uhrbacteria bacterium CG10_big_fil_rev_8_21_14_0_10_50_16]|uniref:Uncharacterized protein n=1 Tax=Candidatus Uhrbacteria bacterium CG10_big_fil_rev_8_21_14_0_10_50_16 TaxID=1975039 RepID=A0A2H0RMW4_9BACT|nr:MAG: hypothetical protein COV06_00185 [Candidatus Uhrbacteria bacterium CG10_big_fil_rev_8_21_14_0_10_50_16]
MIEAWQQRSEPIGLFVGAPEFPLLHTVIGDRAHRFVVRGQGMPLVVQMHPNIPVRTLVSCLVIGRRVGCYLNDEDDIMHTAHRLLRAAPGHIARLPVAVWDGGAWSQHLLYELA